MKNNGHKLVLDQETISNLTKPAFRERLLTDCSFPITCEPYSDCPVSNLPQTTGLRKKG